MLRLEELRKKMGLSQEDLAKKINMTQQRISAYEKGKREPDLETLKVLADFFGVTTDFLLGKDETMPVTPEFTFAYHKETEGLSEEEIKDALEFYKKIKYGKMDKKKEK